MSGEISDISVAAAKARAGRLLLAFRHGNQQAFDAALPEEMTAEESRDLVSALTWVANEAVGKAYRSDAADRVLVLDDGVITAEDTHRNLLAGDENYCLAVAR